MQALCSSHNTPWIWQLTVNTQKLLGGWADWNQSLRGETPHSKSETFLVSLMTRFPFILGHELHLIYMAELNLKCPVPQWIHQPVIYVQPTGVQITWVLYWPCRAGSRVATEGKTKKVKEQHIYLWQTLLSFDSFPYICHVRYEKAASPQKISYNTVGKINPWPDFQNNLEISSMEIESW